MYEGDFVIVTVPLGVLKHKDITFSPELSDEKLNAIEAVGTFSSHFMILNLILCLIWNNALFNVVIREYQIYSVF